MPKQPTKKAVSAADKKAKAKKPAVAASKKKSATVAKANTRQPAKAKAPRVAKVKSSAQAEATEANALAPEAAPVEEKNVDTGIVCLKEVMGIADAQELQQLLAEKSIKKQSVQVDASKVSKVDTAILQVLLASAIAGRFSGRPLSWVGVSEGFKAGAKRLGLAAELGLPK